jgi:hypothetical protein
MAPIERSIPRADYFCLHGSSSTSRGFSSRATRVARARPRARHTACPAGRQRGCCDPGEESRATNGPSTISAGSSLSSPHPPARPPTPHLCDRRHSPPFRATCFVVSHPKHPLIPSQPSTFPLHIPVHVPPRGCDRRLLYKPPFILWAACQAGWVLTLWRRWRLTHSCLCGRGIGSGVLGL